jgi:hypothetical protein
MNEKLLVICTDENSGSKQYRVLRKIARLRPEKMYKKWKEY